MKMIDLEFERADRVYEKKSDFIKRCIFNNSFETEYKIAENHLEQATDTDDFIERVLNDKNLAHTQGYAILGMYENPRKHWYNVREMFGDKQFKTYSDVGGVKIGNETFSLIIPNGYGDGFSRVAVFENRKEFNVNMMNYFTNVRGNFNIYSSDCGNNVEMVLNGEYSVFFYDGFVAFLGKGGLSYV